MLASKLGVLLVRTLSKPLAQRIKTSVVAHPQLEPICVELGQVVHRLSATLTVLAAGHRTVTVKPLDRSTALNRGADVIGEAVVFSVAGATIIYEVSKTRAKAAAAERERVAAQRARDEEAAHERHILREEMRSTKERIGKLEADMCAIRELLEVRTSNEAERSQWYLFPWR
uniref:OPA3-like protein n=1 Tax=Rhizochromulina marina TaxID=1034831 RepID=A0A7S2WW66_9STRA|mmetsp:Transcript_9608/g.27249  ORF Transcript_9608/g.27249 Transcript_9608/m.27249 type:complete len:172 (+) Transcript_9608:192-707(+)